MAWFDPGDWFLGDNPIYRRGVRPIAASALPPLRALGTLLTAFAGIAALALAFAVPWAVGILYLSLSWLAPAVAASSLAGEREAGTLPTLLVTPYPRMRILLGLTAARMRWWTAACFWSLPYMIFVGGIEGARSGLLADAPLFSGALWGAAVWLVLAGAYLFAVSVGVLTAVHFRSALPAIACAYGTLLVVHLISACLNGWPLLIFFIAYPYVFLKDAANHFERANFDE